MKMWEPLKRNKNSNNIIYSPETSVMNHLKCYKFREIVDTLLGGRFMVRKSFQ